MSKRRHNFGTKRFKEKSHFIFHARIALKSLILLFVHLIARGARIGNRHTDSVTLAHARRGLIIIANPQRCPRRRILQSVLNTCARIDERRVGKYIVVKTRV